MPLTASHLAPPALAAATLPRPALTRQLLDGGLGRLTLVHGLPGSGKTVLLASAHAQLHAEGAAVAWLMLSPAHGDPARLQADLRQALCTPLAAGASAFIDGLDQLPAPAAQTLVEGLLAGLPPTARVIAAGLPLRGAALQDARLRGLVRTIGPDALRLDDGEAAALLAPAYNALQARHLNRFLEGWAAGLRFFAEWPIAIDTSAEGDWPLPAAMAEYFDDVVCLRIAPPTLDALAQLAVLERFTPALLHALPEPPCAWPLVDAHIRAGLFLRWRDAAREWAMFHPAFGQHLRQRLRRSRPARHAQLKQFAADWFRQHGFGAEAVRHAAALDDPQQAARIIEHVGAINVDVDDGPDTLAPRLLPPASAAQWPLLFLGQTYQRIRRGRQRQAHTAFRQAWALTDGFTRLDAGCDAATAKTWADMMCAVFRLVFDEPVAPCSLSQLAQAMERHQDPQPVLAASIASVLALAHLDAARYAEALDVCNAGMAALPQPVRNKAAMWVRQHQSSAMLALHSVADAQRCIEDAWRLAHIEGHPESYEVLSTQLHQGIVLYEGNQPDAAMALIAPALARIRTVNGWVRLYADSYAAAAAVACQQGGWEAAEAILRAGEAFAHERHLPRLRDALAVIRLRELTRSGQWQPARQWLDTEPLAALLASADEDGRAMLARAPALHAAAQLMLELGQPREAQRHLARMPAAFIGRASNRLRLRHHVLLMRTHHAQRRTGAALAHLREAVEIARLGGLLRQMLEDAHRVVDILANCTAAAHALPDSAMRYVDEVLKPLIKPQLAPQAALDSPRGCQPHGALSPREGQIIALMAEGLINKEIATRLGISEGTVKTHRKGIHEKLGVTTRSQAIRRARELLLI